MNKLILVLVTIFGASVSSAQIQFGVKAGLNIASLIASGSDYGGGTSPGSRTNFNGGLMASLPLFSTFFLQPELIYSGQGQSINTQILKATINFDYLNLPLLFKYQHASGLYAGTGPQIGFLLSAKEKYDQSVFDIKSSSQTIDFSWTFGIGYKPQSFPIGIDLRYNLGITSVYKPSRMANAYNSVIQVDLFYLFSGK